MKQYTYKDKINFAQARILQFLKECKNQETIISFSGGRDSCVLRHMVHDLQNKLGFECSKCLIANEIFHPETLKFLQHTKTKDDIFLPSLKSINNIFEDDGFPIISKQVAQKIWHIRNTHNHHKYLRAIFGLNNNTFACLPLRYVHFLDKNFCDYKISHKCCDYMKGRLKHDKRCGFVGTTIQESRLRKNSWLKCGCIQYKNGKPNICKPLSLLNENDIKKYIDENNIEISKIYELGYTRSGCVCCGFGLDLEEKMKQKHLLQKNRFELLYETSKPLFMLFFEKYKMWKPLADMGISLNINDENLLTNFYQRKEQVKNWYKNFDLNFNRVLDEIESRNPNCWNKEERNWILKKYSKAKFINYGK